MALSFSLPFLSLNPNLRLNKKVEASAYLETYANSLPVNERTVWFAFRDFFRNDFGSAAKFFAEAGAKQYALGSRLIDNPPAVTEADLALLIGSNIASNEKLVLYNKMYDLVDEVDVVRRRFVKIEILPYIPERHVENNELNARRGALYAELEKNMIGFAIEQAPPLPVPAMQDFEQSSQYVRNKWVTRSSLFWFLLCVYGMSAVRIEKNLKIKGFLARLPWSVGLISWISRKGWHSRFARSIAVRIVQMEPEDEKGLFSEEIKRIRTMVFPADILAGLWYRFKAQRILAAKHINTEEQEDLVCIHDMVRRFSARLIPQGNEQSLSIVSTLRDRADAVLQNYRKNKLMFLPARNELLSVQKELRTLADILEFAKPDLTNYHLLGLEPTRNISDKDIRSAYLSVIGVIHPDKNPNNEFLGRLSPLVISAYGALSKPSFREVYNITIGL